MLMFNVIKLFTGLIYAGSSLAGVFVPGKPFQPRLMHVYKDVAYPQGLDCARKA